MASCSISDYDATRETTAKVIDQQISGRYAIYHGDCVEVLKGIPTDSLHYSISSCPFSSLYSYTDALEDMSNVRSDAEFWDGMGFMIRELYRAMMPGRLVSTHCMNLPNTVERDGFIGIRDFRGDLIRAFERAGFIFHSEVVIWKDPLLAMQRTKALGLLHKQIVKDSAMCRQGIPDYLVTMRKPGRNPEPVSHTPAGFDRWIGDPAQEPKVKPTSDPKTNKYSHEVWQRYASPVWMDIDPGNTLQRASAREDDDSRHICPLQLDVIERSVELWSNPDDVVFSPFAGIGSEGYAALKMGRRFVGSELKRSYFDQACRNLEYAEKLGNAQGGLFAVAE